MNEHVAIKRQKSPDYEVDGYGWAMAQTALIRDGRSDEIDWENVAEEIESVGKRERSTLKSHLIQVIIHMLKWDVQPERRGKSWYVSIGTQRVHAQDALRENPSLKPTLDEVVSEATNTARRLAAIETKLPEKHFDLVSYSVDDVFNRPFEWDGDED